ncbi:TPA: antirestriction protein ArdA [Legionella pneumophila]|uniref:antirestriction protein ArdA n=1 Tax=Legionella pneumophila TaxID=446 RepID=UPI0005C8AA7B|nr:antirestriction protein ArdA [Legionella pneumophila]HCC3243522.1 antirestriction protein ArdA [Legionella pneumophila subsp. pneumophila]MCZ4683373.1 antirestriction protein ArdA [Legionella pneumophila]HDV5790006.1 antirestriction protein ArdA [Legionella pneumophila]HDV5798989.1 antirestriction protein ArdA [Legionella pneumophila]HDV5948554.1 antirestriction protein ArdA [Legionella pneumophila]
MDTPQIYVACLAAYNNGILHGKWVDATQDVSTIYDEIHEMLVNSPIEHTEEFAIHDFEGFGSAKIGEYDSINDVAELASFIMKHGELGAELFSYYSIEDAERMLEENYHGAYDNEVDFASALFDDCYSSAIPEDLLFYFDYEAFARDLFINDYFSVEADGQTHVFSSY